MEKIIGITGQPGFIGYHCTRYLESVHGWRVKSFEDRFFDDPELLREYVRDCDAIIHLAAVNRHDDMNVLYQTNIRLTKKLLTALDETESRPHLLYSSSTQEERDNLYGRSKKECRRLLSEWAKAHNTPFTGMILPNVYGPFGRPHYNSFVSTFCHLLATGEGQPQIHVDAEVGLIYVQEICARMGTAIESGTDNHSLELEPTGRIKVSDTLRILEGFRDHYLGKGVLPDVSTPFPRNLFNTFRSYIPKDRYPMRYTAHRDDRGSFVELARTGSGGQFSFSTTVPGITRGNHYHLRKIERFSVVSGQAVIRLRRVGTREVHIFEINGDEPAFIDIPVFYTHNITNTGEDILYTAFWINEFYNPEDPDTFYEEV